MDEAEKINFLQVCNKYEMHDGVASIILHCTRLPGLTVRDFLVTT